MHRSREVVKDIFRLSRKQKSINAGVAQLVEQRIRNAQVAGSSPATSSKNPKAEFLPWDFLIRQVARIIAKDNRHAINFFNQGMSPDGHEQLKRIIYANNNRHSFFSTEKNDINNSVFISF